MLTTVLFAMAHGVRPWDSPALFLDRFAFGLVAAYLVVRTAGLEASIAAHAANNVATLVFAALTNSVGSSLQAAEAPWPLVAVDIAKFTLFAAIAVTIAKRGGFSNRTGALAGQADRINRTGISPIVFRRSTHAVRAVRQAWSRCRTGQVEVDGPVGG